MNALERFGNAVGGALAGVAATLAGADNDPPAPRPVPAVVIPTAIPPLPPPRPDFEVVVAPTPAEAAGGAGVEAPAPAVAVGNITAPAPDVGNDPAETPAVAAVTETIPVPVAPVGEAAGETAPAVGTASSPVRATSAPPARETVTAVARLSVPLPRPRPDSLGAPNGVTIEEGDSIPPGGDVVAAAPTPGPETPSGAAAGQQFAFAAPDPVSAPAPFASVVAPPAVLPPGEDHQAGRGADAAAAGDAELGAVVLPLPAPRPESIEPVRDLGAVVLPLPLPRPDAEDPPPAGQRGYVSTTQVAALQSPPSAPALIARLNTDPPSPACIARLRELGVEFEILEPIVTDAGCGTSQPLLVRGLHNGAVALDPPATLDCDMVETLVEWVDGEVQPAAVAEFEARVTGLQVAASYSCRGVNGANSGPLSEHAYANALDVSGFEIGGEEKVAVLAQDDAATPTAEFLTEIRGAACDHFHTVLGPGSDPSHWNHFHLDLAPRGRNGDSRFCQ